MRAQVHIESGDRQKGIEMLVEAPNIAPDQQHAYGALCRAAELLQEDREIARAGELYESFLASPSRDFPMRRKAEKALEEMQTESLNSKAGS